MQFSITADLEYGSSNEPAQWFDGPSSSHEPLLDPPSEKENEVVPFLREVEGMVDKALKAVEAQITGCVQALVREMPDANSRTCRSLKFSSTWHRGN